MSQPTPTPSLIPVRTEGGRLLGMLDPATAVLHIRRGHEVDRVDLSRYAQAQIAPPPPDRRNEGGA